MAKRPQTAYNKFTEELAATSVLSEAFKHKLRILVLKTVEESYQRGVKEGKTRARRELV